MEYRRLLNMQGLRALAVPCQIPDYRLMIGNAEDLSPQPIMVFTDFMPQQVAQALPDVTDMSYEDIQQDLASGKLTIDDFFTNVYPLGEALM